jgi:hypothetical protein
MSASEVLLLICAVLFVYGMSGCWLLQVMAYPTYSLVGEKEFVPFHVESGRRLIPVFVIPAVLACLLGIALVVLRPPSMPLLAALIVAACAIIILATTAIVEVPKHQWLDKNGKSEDVIQALIRSNLPRALSWTVGSAVLVWQVAAMVSQ